jgi:Mrp family chromosome partitioning ATPase
MNALDKAFIRAYAKGQSGGGVTAVVEQDEPRRVEQAAAASQNRAAMEVARLAPLVEVSASDGVWYRIEQAPSGFAGGPAPHFSPHEYRATRIPADAVRAAVESNLSAAEMLDTFLGLPANPVAAPRAEQHVAAMRVDTPHTTTAQESAASSNDYGLSPGELQAFEQGAQSSVITEAWDAHLVHGASLESLCQCWLATEMLASPVLVEETWTAPAPHCEALQATAAPKPAPEEAPSAAAKAHSSRPSEKQAATKTQPKPQTVEAPAPPPQPSATLINRPNAPPAFQAAWEVDRLNWPEECDKLARGDSFGPLAKTLVETGRRGLKVIAITGTRRGEGRTTLALCLARRVAKEGVRVVLIDADFECPHLGRSIGIDMENGWDDVLTDNQPLSEAAVSSLEDQLTVLPLGRRAAAFVSAHTVTALQRASEAFDLVLLDMGPAPSEEAGEPAGEGPSAAAALVVHDRRHASQDEISQALDRLHAAGIETLGIVETFA